MNVSEKSVRAKEAIQSIATHDDDPFEDIEAALNELKKFIDNEKISAKKRRQEKEESEK